MDQEVAASTSSSSLPPFSALCSSNIESLLNALFPDDDTLANHLNYPETMTSNCDDHDMDTAFDFNLFMGNGYNEQLPPTSYSSSSSSSLYNNHHQSYDQHQFKDNGIDPLDQLLATNFGTTSPANSASSSCYSSSSYTSPTNASPASYSPSTSRPSSYQPESHFTEVNSWPPSLRRPYTDSQANYLNPMDIGFKPAITLNTPHTKTNEPWRASVAKKILEAYYSPLSLKSEFLATQSALDEFQSLALKEAVAAFHDVALCNSAVGTTVCVNKFVETCAKVRAYRRLHFEDKVTLLTNVFYDTIAMKSVITYDHLSDSWNCSGKRIDRREVYRMDPILHDGIVRIIETYPDRWRNDLTAAAIIYLIVIFNPEFPDLKFGDSIRQEQYGYIYLLRRYLEACCESPCDASDYHYRLMCKIDEIQSLRKNMITLFDAATVGGLPYKHIITTLIK